MGGEKGVGEFTPAELREKFLGPARKTRVSGCRGLDGARRPARRQLAEAQIGREAGGRVGIETIALAGVVGQGVLDEAAKGRACAVLAGRLAERQFARPVRRDGGEAERGDGRSSRRFLRPGRGRGFKPHGGGERRRQGAKTAMAAPEGRESPGGFSVSLRQLPGLAHQPPVVADRLDAARLQRRLDAGVERDACAFVAAVPGDAPGVRRRGEAQDDPVRLALDDVEPRAAPGEAALETRQRLGEPPLRRPARRPSVFRTRVVDIDMEGRTARRGGGRRLVVEAEVVAKPDDVHGSEQPFHIRRRDRGRRA